jgi:hypothetical protein
LIKIRQAQSCFRPPDLSVFRFSSHVQPPPKRLRRRMRTSHAVEDGIVVIRQMRAELASEE